MASKRRNAERVLGNIHAEAKVGLRSTDMKRMKSALKAIEDYAAAYLRLGAYQKIDERLKKLDAGKEDG